MTPIARQVQRRYAKSPEGLLKHLNSVTPNYRVSAPVEAKIVKRKIGDYTPKPNPRKKLRKVFKAARRANRG